MTTGKRGRPRKVPTAPSAESHPAMIEDFGEVLKTRPLEELELHELVERAINVYRIPLTPQMAKDKDTIIQAIKRINKEGGYQDFALDASKIDPDRIPPGWAKIKLFKENITGALNFPLPVGHNGYIIGIPRDVEVLVPIKVVDGPLQDAVEKRRMYNPATGERTVQEVHVQPFQEYGRTPGPDPRPNLTRERKFRPRQQFRDTYGFWPTADQLRAAIQDGNISLT